MRPIDAWNSHVIIDKPDYNDLAWLLWWAASPDLSEPGWPAHEDVFEDVASALKWLIEHNKINVTVPITQALED